MDRQEFIRALFARAKEVGFEDCEVFLSESEVFSTGVFKGEIIDYSASSGFGLGFRGLFGGRMGYASTQVLDSAAIEQLVRGAMENAQLIDGDDPEELYPGSPAIAMPRTGNPALGEITPAEKIEMARELERRTLARDPRMAQVDSCSVASEDSRVRIVNTLGLDVSESANCIGAFVSAIARDGDRAGTGTGYRFVLDREALDLGAIAAEAADAAIAALDAQSIPSGNMGVVFAPRPAASLLSTFSGVFSAEAAQKGLSLLAGKEGTEVAAPCVTLVDDPHRDGSPSSAAFDGEGVPTRVKRVIDAGRLTTLLHNLKTARKQGVETTANAARSYSSTMGISPSNFYFAPSDMAPEALLERLGDGLLITEIAGLHAGANAASGDFSLSAKGFCVRGGKRAQAVNQITVAGNFFALLKSILAVGSDLCFGPPAGSCYGSPSLLVSSLSIAGRGRGSAPAPRQGD